MSEINDKIEEINLRVASLYRDDISEQEKIRIRLWLAERGYEKLKEEALEKAMKENFDVRESAENNHKYIRDNWKAISGKLELNESTIEWAIKFRQQKKTFKRKTAPFWGRPGRVAAVLIPLFIIGAGIGLLTLPTPDNKLSPMIAVSVPAQSKQTLNLPDGTVIELQPGTKLSYAEDFINNRVVDIDGGAYFKVAKMRGQSFTVNTNSITVSVLGTEFQLTAAGSGSTAELKLTTGIVSVKSEGNEDVVLQAGEYLIYDRQSSEIEISLMNEGEVLSLRRLPLTFSGDQLYSVLEIIEGYFGVKVKVDPAIPVNTAIIADYEYGETLEEVMSILQIINQSFNYRIEGDTVYITEQ